LIAKIHIAGRSSVISLRSCRPPSARLAFEVLQESLFDLFGIARQFARHFHCRSHSFKQPAAARPSAGA
jgi:hypothetical protein